MCKHAIAASVIRLVLAGQGSKSGDAFEWGKNLFSVRGVSGAAQFLGVIFTVGRSTPCLHCDGRWVNMYKHGALATPCTRNRFFATLKTPILVHWLR